SRRPQGARVGFARPDVRVRHPQLLDGGRQLTVAVVAPAEHRAVGPDGARVLEARAHLQVRAGWWRKRAAPAQERPVRLDPAGMYGVLTDAHRLEGAGRR